MLTVVFLALGLTLFGCESSEVNVPETSITEADLPGAGGQNDQADNIWNSYSGFEDWIEQVTDKKYQGQQSGLKSGNIDTLTLRIGESYQYDELGNLAWVVTVEVVTSGNGKGYNTPIMYDDSMVYPVSHIRGKIYNCELAMGKHPEYFYNMYPSAYDDIVMNCHIMWWQDWPDDQWVCSGNFIHVIFVTNEPPIGPISPEWEWGHDELEHVKVRDNENQDLPFVRHIVYD